MNGFIINGIVALIGIIGGYLITTKTSLRNHIKSKLDEPTYNLLKNVAKDICQFVADKFDLENRKAIANSKIRDFAEEHGIDISEEEIDIIRHSIIEEAKKVKEA